MNDKLLNAYRLFFGKSEIDIRYKELLFKTHPDHNQASGSQPLRNVIEAYDLLKKEETYYNEANCGHIVPTEIYAILSTFTSPQIVYVPKGCVDEKDMILKIRVGNRELTMKLYKGKKFPSLEIYSFMVDGLQHNIHLEVREKS